MQILQYLINGISIGAVYAIIALGYTMVYGIAKMLNFAHGDVIMVGAYISFCVTTYLGLPAIVSVIAAVIVCTLLGITIEGLENDSEIRFIFNSSFLDAIHCLLIFRVWNMIWESSIWIEVNASADICSESFQYLCCEEATGTI